MSEIIAGKKTYTLLDLAESIQRMFSTHYSRKYWVKAEMNKLNFYNQSGHCYPELLQKENGKTVAEFKSILWKNDYERINRLFVDQIKERILFMEKELDKMLDSFLKNLPNLWHNCLKQCA